MKTLFSSVLAITGFLFLSDSIIAQSSSAGKDKEIFETIKPALPFKVLTSGKRITIQSKNANNNIKRLMVWTATGHRIVEQKDLEANNYSFTMPVNEKIFFLMVEMKNGKRFTEKFGVQ